MSGAILHHYDASPFSEKVRVMFGLKELAWSSVVQPNMMPKPNLVPLSGGYRRIPVMQIGADVYCDSQVILAEIEARWPDPPVVRPGDWATNLWADRLYFQASVPVVFAEWGTRMSPDFIADREKLSGRPFDVPAMTAAAAGMSGQWRAQATWIEQGLRGQDFLGGASPSLGDIAAFMNVWWLYNSVPKTADRLLNGLGAVHDWRRRMRAIGHGERQEMDGHAALQIARSSEPLAPPAHDPNNIPGLQPGDPASVTADDYGREPIEGRLVAIAPDRIIIARDNPPVGRVNLHFPRVGFHVGLTVGGD
jgi:glutathione S-transferase